VITSKIFIEKKYYAKTSSVFHLYSKIILILN
jgi:hypothetical protein